MRVKKLLQSLGPGLLFAGAAVGVSHLVYSTRAGANYGFGLIWLVLIANLFKYPFFEFGPRYAAATGESLLKGYQRLGNWVLILFVFITLGTMFTVQAAVTIVTASLAAHLFGGVGLMSWVGILLVICSALLLIGRYNLLDHLMKFIIITLTVLTLITVFIAFSSTPDPISWTQEFPMEGVGLAFVIAFMGWMPAPMDLSVWHSLWTLEKQKNTAGDFNLKKSLFDFNIGYIGTTILAFFFVALGALVMYNSGTEFSPKGAVFAKQLIDLYIATLGSGAGFFVGMAAFITMFSTTITCLDALPRSMARAHSLLVDSTSELSLEKVGESTSGMDGILDAIDQEEYLDKQQIIETPRKYYLGWLLVLVLGSLVILNIFLTNMGSFLIVATTLSFLTAPFFAIANYILVMRYLPKSQQPSKGIKVLSWVGITYLFVFCGIYIWSLL
jgi:Mn2+/Fe2+ NRAMP family transporter